MGIIMKFLGFALVVSLFLNLPCPVYAGSYFISANGSEENREITAGYKMKFGSQEETKENKIKQLKQEDTKGAAAGIGLVILGACIVVAAVLVVNKADDITDRAEDKTDDIISELRDKYDEEKKDYEDKYSSD